MAISCSYMPTCLSSSTSRFCRNRVSCSASSPSMEPLHSEPKTKLMEFPYVSAAHRDLMLKLVSAVETRLDSVLLSCTLPADVQSYQNPSGSACGALLVRSGAPSSPIDFILGSWIHCKFPEGGSLNITSLSAYLRPSTDAPNLLLELIRKSPESLILVLDLPPRKDLALNPEYLKAFYEDTKLDKHRKLLQNLPEVKPFFSSSLYVRSVVSPTAIMVSIEAGDGQSGRIDEIIRDHMSPVAEEMIKVWLDVCACGKREVGEDERAELRRRDQVVKNKTIEIDLETSFPRIFGQELADRVIGVLRKIYNNV